MKLLDKDITTNNIVIIPRNYNAFLDIDVKITRDGTKTTETVTASSHEDTGKGISIDLDFTSLIEGAYYFMEVSQSSSDYEFDSNTQEWCYLDTPAAEPNKKVIFKDKAFVTGSSNEEYSINKGEFTIDVSTDSDEIKIYE
mgnify:FL=1|tara:strand:+ start:2300 stop:2722 length:423 start_codon:yes stop_codon:yes gene_type:complete